MNLPKSDSRNRIALLTLSEIQAKVQELAQVLNAPPSCLPTYGYSTNTGHPHVEIDSQGYYYAAFDRNTVAMQHHTKEIDQLLWWIFVDITWALASQYENVHRDKNQDQRRLIFEHQVKLLNMLSPQWGERQRHEQERILEQHPFHDRIAQSGS